MKFLSSRNTLTRFRAVIGAREVEISSEIRGKLEEIAQGNTAMALAAERTLSLKKKGKEKHVQRYIFLSKKDPEFYLSLSR